MRAGTVLGVAMIILVIIAGVLLAVGRNHQGDAVSASVRELWLSPEQYEGRQVIADGTLRVFLPGTPREHYAIEDAERFRVGVRGISADELAPLVDRSVEVEGTLRITEDAGIYIQVEQLEPARAAAASSVTKIEASPAP